MELEIPNYIDAGHLREQDRIPLDTFLGDQDRTEITGRGVPFFSGREVEVNAFRSVARKLRRGRPGNATVIVEGPPGAGKSALLAQFEEEMRAFPPVGSQGRRWLPVFLDGGQACSPAAIMQRVDWTIDTLGPSLGVPMHERAVRGGWRWTKELLNRGPSVLGVSAGAKAEQPPQTIGELAERRRDDWSGWQIVLLIDEAQGISADLPGSSDPGTLATIHQGAAGMPISFCAFGLPGTAEALDKVRVSRTSVAYDLRLGGLTGKASRMAVRRCFAQYGVTHGEEWEEAVLARSANWPQHLAAYLNAALTSLKDHAPSPDALGSARGASLTAAIALGDQGRSGYYGRRLARLTRGGNEAFRGFARALVAPLRGSPDGLMYQEVLDILADRSPSPSRVDEFLSAAVHSGFLAKDDSTGLHRMPIPSFGAHILNEPLPKIGEGRSEGRLPSPG